MVDGRRNVIYKSCSPSAMGCRTFRAEGAAEAKRQAPTHHINTPHAEHLMSAASILLVVGPQQQSCPLLGGGATGAHLGY